MSTDAEDDRALLTRHAAGDRHAFAELVQRHRDRLWRVALRTLGDADDAADAVQDALLSAYRSAATFRGDAAVTTWLHRIVVNACLDLARKRANRPTVPLIGPDGGVDPPDPAATAAYDDHDTAAAVVRGLRGLPIDQAAAVVLVDIEGFSVRAASEILGVPEGTVKSRCARARARLAEALSELAPQPAAAAAGNPVPDASVQPDEADARADDPRHHNRDDAP